MYLVTGGAGFIGSSIVDRLINENEEVHVIDIKKTNVNEKANYIQKNILDDFELKGVKTIFHYAAEPDVRKGLTAPYEMYQNNVEGTFKMLEFARKNDVKNFVFASTSTVYGNAKMPTPETEECNPISLYGATKLACENLINSYSNLYGIKSTVLRYANIIGERSDHGVIIDFKNKLKQNPNELEILGNGQQKKSYLYIDDTIEATFTAYKKQTKNYDVFNVGSDESITVNELAELVSNSLNLKPKFKYTSNELKGWKGDVSLMLLDSSKIKRLGWTPKTNINEAIRKIVLNIK